MGAIGFYLGLLGALAFGAEARAGVADSSLAELAGLDARMPVIVAGAAGYMDFGASMRTSFAGVQSRRSQPVAAVCKTDGHAGTASIGSKEFEYEQRGDALLLRGPPGVRYRVSLERRDRTLAEFGAAWGARGPGNFLEYSISNAEIQALLARTAQPARAVYERELAAAREAIEQDRRRPREPGGQGQLVPPTAPQDDANEGLQRLRGYCSNLPLPGPTCQQQNRAKAWIPFLRRELPHTEGALSALSLRIEACRGNVCQPSNIEALYGLVPLGSNAVVGQVETERSLLYGAIRLRALSRCCSDTACRNEMDTSQIIRIEQHIPTLLGQPALCPPPNPLL